MATTEDTLFTESPTASSTTPIYDDDFTDEVCESSNPMHFGIIFTSVFFSIVVILSLFGNILVIVILAKYENLKSLTNTFILNLAVSDLFFTAGLPFWASYHLYGWTFGESVCKIVNFMYCFGFNSSSILLILMTAHRYLAVMKPLSDIVSTTGSNSVVASVVIWAASILITSPAFIFVKVQDQNICDYVNSVWTLWGIYMQNSLFALSSVVFIFCYAQIICRLMRPTAQRRKVKTFKLIFALMVVFFVGWAPYNIVIFLDSMHFWSQDSVESKVLVAKCKEYDQLQYAFYISRIFSVSQCCLNPVFYVFVGVKFKNHLKKMVNSMGNNKSSIRNRQSRLTITSLTSGDEFSL